VVLLAAILSGGIQACGHEEPARTIPGGDADLGREQLVNHGCGACHMIPGIELADGTVGPSLEAFSRRAYIAGLLPNTADNIVAWIVMPQSILPGGAMPNLGVSDRQARNMAANLYTLR
jgi:cytochrome c2